jgi:predicted acylesterase/phospholipase RssA
LAIAGAIFKRSFDVTGRSEDLIKAREYYDAAVTQAVLSVKAPAGARTFADNGYAAINAAFVRDLLVHVEGVSDSLSLRKGADALRAEVVSQLEPVVQRVRDIVADGGKPGTCHWWSVVTLAEAKLGMGDPAAAHDLILLFPPDVLVKVGDWERETTARQFSRLADIRRERLDEQADEVAALLAHIAQCGHPSYEGSLRGQLGLALSGGGFRASFFHLGVLARLAELDLLRHVGVLSCVSGGSIVGAHYYLALQQMLESTPEASIDREMYIGLVHQAIRSFRSGTNHNIRNRAFADPRNLFRKVRSRLGGRSGFNRTTRVGELFDRYLYTGTGKAPSIQPRPLRDLLVTPVGETSFNPKRHNWRRAAKVPMFVINATTLNNGNNWQFTATWVGEPDSDFYGVIDDLSHIDRMYLADEVPPTHRDLPLRSAVGASAAVPGVFPPTTFDGLVPASDGVIRLVDGGVQDNQGVGALIDEDCTHIFISDASGQLSQTENPPSNALQVLMRSSSIQARTIRTSVLHGVDDLQKTSRLNKAWTVHLTRGLARQDRDDPNEVTEYGIPVRVQSKLAQIRTDLDRFSDTEAFALMLSGYQMADHELNQAPPPFPTSRKRDPTWPFLELVDVISEPRSQKCADLVRDLDLGQHLVLRGLRRRLPGHRRRTDI